ncbi:unnamed protein product [Cunninghamella blakesleeana]
MIIKLSPISTLTTIVILGLTTKYIYYTIKTKKEKEKYKDYYDIPSPPFCFPFFGHLPLLGPSFALKLSYWHKTYGPLLRIQMGTQSWLTISDPVMADELLEQNKHLIMTRPYHRFIDEHYSDGGRGLVYSSSADIKYKNARNTVLKYISSEAIVDPLIEYEVDDFIERIIKKTHQDSSVDPFWDLKLMCINTFMTVAFAKRLNSINDYFFKDGEAILKESFPLIGVNGDPASFLSLFKWFPFLAKSTAYIKKVIQHRNQFFDHMIQHGLHETYAHNLVKEIYLVKNKYGFDDDDILVTISDMNGMASELPPTAFAWCIAILANHPSVQEKIHKEVTKYMDKHNGEFPRINDMHHFPYTQSVLKECLRYRCSNNFTVPRKFEQDVILKGKVIPKNTVIVVPNYAMHLNESIYEEADTFKPDRFIKKTSTILSTYNADKTFNDRDVHLFGFGPRHCPGIQMVERQLFYLLVRLFYKCKIERNVDKNGNFIDVDLNQVVDFEVMIRPAPFDIRAIEILPPTPQEGDFSFCDYDVGDEEEDDDTLDVYNNDDNYNYYDYDVEDDNEEEEGNYTLDV